MVESDYHSTVKFWKTTCISFGIYAIFCLITCAVYLCTCFPKSKKNRKSNETIMEDGLKKLEAEDKISPDEPGSSTNIEMKETQAPTRTDKTTESKESKTGESKPTSSDDEKASSVKNVVQSVTVPSQVYESKNLTNLETMGFFNQSPIEEPTQLNERTREATKNHDRKAKTPTKVELTQGITQETQD